MKTHRSLEDNLAAMLAELSLKELQILRKRFADDPEHAARVDAAIAKKVEQGEK